MPWRASAGPSWSASSPVHPSGLPTSPLDGAARRTRTGPHARRGQARRRLPVRAASSGRRDRRATRRARHPVPCREAAGRRRCRGPGPARGSDRALRSRRRRRLSPARAGGGVGDPPPIRRAPATDGRRALARLDAAPGVVGPGGPGRRPVVEQATHFYDLARHLLGEAEVLGAISTRDPSASPPSIDVVDATAALLRFDRGAIGSFANTRRLASSRIEIEFVSDDLLTTLRPAAGTGAGRLACDVRRRPGGEHVPAGRDPYEVAGRGVPRRRRGLRPVASPPSYGRAPDRPADAGRRRATGAPG